MKKNKVYNQALLSGCEKIKYFFELNKDFYDDERGNKRFVDFLATLAQHNAVTIYYYSIVFAGDNITVDFTMGYYGIFSNIINIRRPFFKGDIARVWLQPTNIVKEGMICSGSLAYYRRWN